MVDLRGEFLNLTATGLLVIGRVGFDVFKLYPEDREMQRALFIDLATKIDWRRVANLWAGSVIASDGRILTSRVPVNQAAERIMQIIGR